MTTIVLTLEAFSIDPTDTRRKIYNHLP